MNRSRLSLPVLASALVIAAGCSSSSGSPTGQPTTDASPNPTPTPGVDAGTPGNDAGDQGDDSGDMTAATEYDATLTGAEVVPAVITSATGTAKLMLQPDGVTLNYDITQNVNGGTAAAIHIGYPGENAGVAYPITPFSGHMTGTITIDSNDADKITSGAFYLDVQSSAHPAGEIRGQIVTPGSEIFVANLTPGQEVPSATSSATGHASLIMNGGKDTARYHFVTTATPTDINVHRAIGSLAGPVAFPFAPNIGQTEDGSLTLTSNDADDLENGRFYINVVTSAHAAGEIRGQLIKPGETLYTAALAGSNEVPPTPSTATGGAQFILSAGRDSLRYEVVVSGIIPTEADLASGAKGSNGSTLYTLMLNATGAQGTQPLKPTEVGSLGSQGLYVNVKTASYPTGELRGQLQAR